MPALFITLRARLSGYLVDRFGRRRLLLGAPALHAAAGGSGPRVETLPGMLAGRAVAVTMTANTALVGDHFTDAARNRHMGLKTSFTSLGGIVSLVGGGLLAEWDWRGPFLIPSRRVAADPRRLRHPARARIGSAWRLAAGFGALAAGHAPLSLATGLIGVMAAPSVAGVGTGLVMPNVAVTALALAPAEMRGRAASRPRSSPASSPRRRWPGPSSPATATRRLTWARPSCSR